MISVWETKRADGKVRYALFGADAPPFETYDSYKEAVDAIRKIKSLKEDYERLRKARATTVAVEESSDALPPDYVLFVARDGNGKPLSYLVIGRFGFAKTSSELRQLVADAWDYHSQSVRGSSPRSPPTLK